MQNRIIFFNSSSWRGYQMIPLSLFSENFRSMAARHLSVRWWFQTRSNSSCSSLVRPSLAWAWYCHQHGPKAQSVSGDTWWNYVLLKDWIATIHDYSFMIVEVYDCWVLVVLRKAGDALGRKAVLLFIFIFVACSCSCSSSSCCWWCWWWCLDAAIYPLPLSMCARGTSIVAAGNPP